MNHVVIQGFADKFGRIWDMRPWDLCDECGQPDNCGDCNHNKLTIDEVKEIGCVGMLI